MSRMVVVGAAIATVLLGQTITQRLTIEGQVPVTTPGVLGIVPTPTGLSLSIVPLGAELAFANGQLVYTPAAQGREKFDVIAQRQPDATWLLPEAPTTIIAAYVNGVHMTHHVDYRVQGRALVCEPQANACLNAESTVVVGYRY